MEQINLTYATIRYQEPIVYLTFKAGAELGFPEMKELVDCAEKLCDKKNYFILSDVREHISVTAEGKRYSAQNRNSPYQRGTAVLVKNSLYKLAVNVFLGIQEPEFPYSVFTEEQKAIDWLLNLPLEDKISSQ